MKRFPYSQHPAFLPIVAYLLILLFSVLLYLCIDNIIKWDSTRGAFSIWFRNTALFLTIPSLGLFSYYKSEESRIAKVLFIALSILLFFPLAIILIGLYKEQIWTTPALVVLGLLARFLKKESESIGNVFLLTCCLSAYLLFPGLTIVFTFYPQD